MRLLVLPRGAGKTTIAIDWLMAGRPLTTVPFVPEGVRNPTTVEAAALRDQIPARVELPHTWNRLLVVATVSERERILGVIRSMQRHMDPSSPVRERIFDGAIATAGQLGAAGTIPRHRDITVAVDELDDVLQILLGLRVELATITPEKEN